MPARDIKTLTVIPERVLRKGALYESQNLRTSVRSEVQLTAIMNLSHSGRIAGADAPSKQLDCSTFALSKLIKIDELLQETFVRK